jgi:preprotein translocase subunit SecG
MRVWVAIWVGSTVICRAVGAWIAGGVALKLIIIGVVAGFIKGLPWTTNITVVLAVGWLVTAVALGLLAPAAEEQEKPEREAPDGPPLPTRDELAAALHKVGAPHAHITALAEHLGTSNERVREGLDGAGIPVSGGVRMKGRKVAVSPGVDKRHFPPLPSPAEKGSTGGVLTSNNNSNNSGEPPREGMSIIQDEANPRRWHVRRRART